MWLQYASIGGEEMRFERGQSNIVLVGFRGNDHVDRNAPLVPLEALQDREKRMMLQKMQVFVA